MAVFATVLLGIGITDAKYFLIPDGFTVFGVFFVLVSAFVALYFGEAEPFARPWEAVLGMCVGAGAIAIVGWLGEVWLKRPAMGFGDVTLMAVVGAAVGPARALLTIFIAAAIAPVILLGIVYPSVGQRTRGRSGTDGAPARGVGRMAKARAAVRRLSCAGCADRFAFR